MSRDPLLNHTELKDQKRTGSASPTKRAVIPPSELDKFNHSKVNYSPSVLTDPSPSSPLLRTMTFFQVYDLAQRVQTAEKIRTLRPGACAVVAHLVPECARELKHHLQYPEKPYLRLAMPLQAPLSDVIFEVRRKLFRDELPARSGFFLYTFGSALPQSSMAISLNETVQTYAEKALRVDDGMLHFLVAVEAVFG